MGLLSGLLGHAAQADIADVERDLEAILIWISATTEPSQRTFMRGQSILEVQKALASYVGR